MKTAEKAYMTAVIAIGAAVFCFSVWRLSAMTFRVDTSFVVNMTVMLLLLILCRMTPVYISEDKTIDVSFAPVVASTMIYGVYPTLVLFAFSSLFLFVKDEVTGKYYYPLAHAPVKELFNLSNILFSVLVGSLPLHWLGGYGADFVFPYSLIPATVFIFLTIFVNLQLFLLYFVSTGTAHYGEMFSQTILGILPNVLCTMPLGMLIAVLLAQKSGVFYILLFMLPLLLARYSFKLYLDSRSMHLRTIASLSRAIDAKDQYTCGHSERVADYADMISREMHLSRTDTQNIHTAALLHDVGKIGIPDTILNKPDRLTKEEYEEIKTHPTTGWQIIQDIRLPAMVNDAVLYHHRFYNGLGYPATGSEPAHLPLAAGILGVADAYDAMTSDRPYRRGMSPQVAAGILRENSGSQFTPAVVDAFLRVLTKKGELRAGTDEEKPS